MKPLKIVILVIGCSLFFACNEKKQLIQSPRDIAIIPEPAQMVLGKGSFEFNSETRFVAVGKGQKEVATLLIEKFHSATGINLQIVEKEPASNFIVFEEDKSLENEAYRLKISNNSVRISANGYSGFLYGFESIRQLLPPQLEGNENQQDINWSIPCLEINDHPRYSWRGLMLDVARHFFKKEYILKTIDRMALFKLNTLHLHLVDDQGWRIEIKKYPKLTEIGGFRVDQEDKHWDARTENKLDDPATYGGFYTQEDIKEIVAFAGKHGITVVPEIEMPAHVMSALAAYPEFSCFDEKIAVPSGGVWPITDIYCPGKEETFEFLQNVLLEVMDLFPSKYVHIGGDEATRTNWEKDPKDQKRMKEEGLKNTAELQSYFIKRIERFISSHGRILLGWDEILEGGLPPGATVMSWRGIQGGWEASEQGHDVVMTPGDWTYFNQYQGDPDYEPIAFGGYVPLSKVYSFDPVVDSMSVAQKKHILGGQANLWSEFITDDKESEYMLYPRLAALSEVLWTPKNKLDWKRFSEKIPALFKRFVAMGITYSRSAYAVTAKSTLNMKNATISVVLSNEFTGSDIRYALDDEKLDTSSKRYSAPIVLDHTTTIKAAVVENGKIVGDTLKKTFNFHKAIGKPVAYDPMYSKLYQGEKEINMVNIIRGSKNFHDGQWQAWLVKDAEITIDLEKPIEISSVAVGSMENQGSGIYYPIQIEVAVSADGKKYTKVGKIKREFRNYGYVGLKDFNIDFEAQKVRFVRLDAKNLGHPPKGGDAWMFLDEIVVE
ncbi:family 20 glycosylhydrolase [Flavobacteriaceae bacterium F89]|uniref:beta-N-acetylhexosaminidase n=1 Tax=Cerina litoralis TaxID=2874477 RepID=A0AAE3EWS6_9FLAO|nr:glycoside hydrolase family 20 protein [Cerina litoralis]MCG2461141.1 family 20 glycosylhydrolase [Cerina litoralis]